MPSVGQRERWSEFDRSGGRLGSAGRPGKFSRADVSSKFSRFGSVGRPGKFIRLDMPGGFGLLQRCSPLARRFIPMLPPGSWHTCPLNHWIRFFVKTFPR